ncbi:hypothetical protein JCM17823_15870 [Halorubrum gandharaense]
MLDLLAWTAAVLLYGVGDLVTTVAGTRHDGIEERTPLTRWLFGPKPSLLGFGLFKLVLLAGFYVAHLPFREAAYAPALPAGIALVGAVAVANNLLAIRRVRRRA